MRIRLIAGAALLAVSGFASAATTDWGLHDPAELGTNFALSAGTALDDMYLFSLDMPVGVMSVSVNNDGAAGAFDLHNSMLELYSGMPGSSVLLGSVSFDSAAVSHDWGALAAGNYYYHVTTVVADTALAGSYLLSSTLVPVPEPGTYGMMLAGLVAGAFVVTRRKTR